MAKRHRIIPIFVPHRGCPHDCVFCNQKKITGLSTEIDGKEVEKIINNYLKTVPSSNQVLEVAFFGGSFTAIDVDIQRELLQVANGYKKRGIIHSIRLSTRPDNIDNEILELLYNNGVDIIELGVQSLNKEVLTSSYRGHSIDDVYTSSQLIKKRGFTLGLQMMIGLPEDTWERSIETALRIIDLKPDFVRIYPTLVIKDTYLEKMYLNKEYYPLEIDDAVEISSNLLMLFKTSHIPVIRLGLQATENISFNKDLVAGPFHPAFRQLVESRVYLKVLSKYLKEKKDLDEVVIGINKSKISYVVGQRSSNFKALKDKFNIDRIKIKELDIKKDYIHVFIGEHCDKIVIDEYLQEFTKEYKTKLEEVR